MSSPAQLLRQPRLLPGRLAAGAVLMRANIVPFERPDRLARAALALLPWGASIPGMVAAAAARYPRAVAILDEDGPLSYDQLWSQSRALAEDYGEGACRRARRCGSSPATIEVSCLPWSRPRRAALTSCC